MKNFFDIGGMYNSQSDRIWRPSRAEANKQGDLQEKGKRQLVERQLVATTIGRILIIN